MGSFALLNTNVGLTTNLKIVVDSNYKLSLDSIESNDRLSLDRYKRFQFNKRSYYDELIPLYYKETPVELAYYINYNNDVDIMSTDFKDQYDELYNYGAKNIINNKNYSEEYEYFAPLYIKKEKLPEGFIIFRVDGPGLGIIDKENFRSEILENFKVIKLFDLKQKTPLGEWLDLNFMSNDFFPKAPLEVDFKELEFTKWNGIDFNVGGYSSKSFFMDDIFGKEQEIFELEKLVFDNYKNNGLVFPNILNLTFLFDDEPSTPDFKRKWSLNRYYGFYLDEIKLVKTITPYKSTYLREDVIVQEGNILYSESNPDNPFIENWNDEKPFYVELDGTFYLVERFTKSGGVSIQKIVDENGNSSEGYSDIILVRYKIISDIDLEGRESELNQNFVYIENNILLDINKNPFIIQDFDSADVWIIEIDGIYHNLKKDENNNIKLFTDYLINSDDISFEYKVGGINKKVSTVVDFRNSPKIFKIYKLNFTDIKSFDNRIIDTEFSKFEYEKLDAISETDETKMYIENISSNNNPKSLDDFIYKEEVVNIPTSSEYTANWETFKIKGKDLSDIWRINPVYCRWGYQNSISGNDLNYLLNNSLIFEDFNRTVNLIETNPIRSERNLDYFYSINSSTSSYIHHSLHIEKVDDDGIDENFSFDFDKYLNLATYSIGTQSFNYNFNYFKYFFERKAYFNNSKLKKNVRKYSKFNEGDNVIPNITLFRGIEFRAYDVDSLILDSNNNIENINLKTTNRFNDYDFSILLSDNKKQNENCSCININITDTTDDSVVNLNLTKTDTFVNDINTFQGFLDNFVYKIEYSGGYKWTLYKDNISISELITEEFISCPIGTWSNINCCLNIEICLTVPSSDCNFTMNFCGTNSCIEDINFDLVDGKWVSEDIEILGTSSTFDAYIELINGVWTFGYSIDNNEIINAGYLNINTTCPVGASNSWILEQTCCLEMEICNDFSECFGVTFSKINENLYEGYYSPMGLTFSIQRNMSGSQWNLFQNDGSDIWTIASSNDLSDCPSSLWFTTSDFDDQWGEESTLDITNGDCVNQFILDTGYLSLETIEVITFVDKCYSVTFEKEGDGYLGETYIEVSGDILLFTFSITNIDSLWTLESDGDIIATQSGDLGDCPINNWNFEAPYNYILSENLCDLQDKILESFDCNLSNNELEWLITDEWKMDKQYNTGDIVIFDDILYIANTQSFTENPTQIISSVSIKSAPFNLVEWDIYLNSEPFWSPLVSYSTSNNDYVYNNGEYYQYIGGTEDFWNPVTAMNSGYNIGDVVLYRGKYYFSMTSSNHYTIDTAVESEENIGVSWKNPVNKFFTPWVATQSTDPNWEPIKIWNPSETYTQDTLIVNNGILWISNSIVEVGEEPGISLVWNRKYSLEPDSNFIYSSNSNPIILLNNRYYICLGNVTNSKLDNGIVVYINEKWKNILININISDNTLPNLSNSDRDQLYIDLYYKLTANNFIQCINDLTNKYGYSNYLKYVIIDKDNNITEHSYVNNIKGLKYILECFYPDQFSVKKNSLVLKPILKPNTLNPTRVLNNFKVDLVSKLDWYNNLPLSVNIEENQSDIKVVKNLHNLVNIVSDDLYRFSGYYMPIFYDIDLFKRAEDLEEIGNWKFDTTLSNFGILRERKIRKVNRKESILKLKNDQVTRSIYPMLDEFGLTTYDFFIFKSSWDHEYYLESSFNSLNIENKTKEDIIVDSKNFGKPKQDKNLNI
jgi:hypothetical protein